MDDCRFELFAFKRIIMIKKHYLFHLGHPAHYQLFKNVIKLLILDNHEVSIVIKKKDILESLLVNDGVPYLNLLPAGRKNSFSGILWGMVKTDYNLFRYCLKNRPDLMIGTSYAISHVGKLLSIPSINVNEDDWTVVPFYAKFSYPWASIILSPSTCDTGKWINKTISYAGYHELAYLHPNRFSPDKRIASKYVDINKPFYILRFASLSAHHDKGIRGLTNELALRVIEILKNSGNIYITSERELPISFEKYQLTINPIHIHHVLAFANLYVGDSQTMAAEAGVLGVPFIRFNDFVGRIGYLNELENIYRLGFGIKHSDDELLITTIRKLLCIPNLKEEWQSRRQKMLSEKIDVANFLTWFIESYPESREIMKANPDYCVPLTKGKYINQMTKL